MSLLDVEGLSVAYGKLQALHDVSLHVAPGELVSVIGANGAGKSSLLNALMGAVPISRGMVRFDGQTLVGLKPYRIARRGVALVPEGRGTLRQLSVRENLILGAFARKNDPQIGRDLDDMLARFPPLAERLHQAAGLLSGGQQQMLVIGRALMGRPRLLLLDEPTLGLAPLIVEQIMTIVSDLRASGVTIVLVEQNAHAALGRSDRAYVLESGRIVLEGRDLIGDSRVRKAYLGEL